MKVKISYLNSQGRDNISEVVDMFSKDRGPLTFELLENNYSSDHFQYHRDLTKISIDDFGTGYSSLEYFKFIPADELKIDKSFIFNMLNSQIDMDIVKLILDWGQRFNMQIVAEGVEEEEDFEVLQELGVDYAQGYLFGLPEPLTE